MERWNWPDECQVAVSLSFDDGRPSNLQYGLPILNAARIGATFYLLPTRVEEKAEEWRNALAMHHEVGNHTVSHPCSGNFSWSRNNALEDFDLDRMKGEIDDASRSLERLFGASPTSFAYPCYQTYVGKGISRKSYVPLVAERFVAGRAGQSEAANDPKHCDLASLFATCIDGLSIEEIIHLISSARRESRWLVLVGHDTLPAPSRQGVETKVLTQLLSYIKEDSAIWCETVSKVATYIQQANGDK